MRRTQRVTASLSLQRTTEQSNCGEFYNFEPPTTSTAASSCALHRAYQTFASVASVSALLFFSLAVSGSRLTATSSDYQGPPGVCKQCAGKLLVTTSTIDAKLLIKQLVRTHKKFLEKLQSRYISVDICFQRDPRSPFHRHVLSSARFKSRLAGRIPRVTIAKVNTLVSRSR